MRRLRYNARPNARLLPDGADSKPVAGGETFEVSDIRAEELLTAPYADVTEAPDFNALTRAELNNLAEQAGIDSSALSTKSDVITALENKPEVADEGLDNTDDSDPQED